MSSAIQSVRTDSPIVFTAKLLAAAPIVAVAEELNRQVGDLARIAPASDATTALTIYRDKLNAALKRAHDLDLFVTADVAALILRRSVSGVTYLCRTGAINAKKVGGTWQIDRVDLERFRQEHDEVQTAPVTTPARAD